MARLMATTSDYLTGTWPISALPISVSCWVRFSSLASAMTLWWCRNDNANDFFNLRIPPSGTAYASSQTTLTDAVFSSGGTTMSTNTWYQVGGVWRSNSYRNHYVNGSPGTAETSSRAVAISNPYGEIGPPGGTLNLEIADFALWTSDIGDAGFAQHADGISARFISEPTLAVYAPLIRGDTDVLGNTTLSVNGTVSASSHAPIIGAIAA